MITVFGSFFDPGSLEISMVRGGGRFNLLELVYKTINQSIKYFFIFRDPRFFDVFWHKFWYFLIEKVIHFLIVFWIDFWIENHHFFIINLIIYRFMVVEVIILPFFESKMIDAWTFSMILSLNSNEKLWFWIINCNFMLILTFLEVKMWFYREKSDFLGLLFEILANKGWTHESSVSFDLIWIERRANLKAS